MPEFEEENVNASPSESYTPSTDASKKPRTRRRSGGFKTEVANVSNANIGEVSANQALKEEKLSGSPSATHSHESRETGESQGGHEDRPGSEREPRAPREPRTDANPQPSPETLAAIASVEAKIAERRAERDARRAERDKNRPAKTERSARKPRKPSGKPVPKKKGLLASILSIFGLGPKVEPAKRRGGKRGGHNKGRGGRPQGKGGNRRGQNRGRGGQNRRRGGQGGNRSNSRSNENSES
jgi:hypothetical protein